MGKCAMAYIMIKLIFNGTNKHVIFVILTLLPSAALANQTCDPSMVSIFHGNACLGHANHNIPWREISAL